MVRYWFVILQATEESAGTLNSAFIIIWDGCPRELHYLGTDEGIRKNGGGLKQRGAGLNIGYE